MKNFLIVKTSSLGDIVHSWPVADYLRKQFPDARIDWVVESRCQDLVVKNPDINRAIIVNTKNWKKILTSKLARAEFFSFKKELQQTHYDAVFDLQGNSKSGFITWLAHSKTKVGFDWSQTREWPNYLALNRHIPIAKNRNIRLDYLGIVQGFFNDLSSANITNKLLTLSSAEHLLLETLAHQIPEKDSQVAGIRHVLVCPGSAWINKQLTEESLLGLLSHYLQRGATRIWIAYGNNAEEQLAISLQNALGSSVLLFGKQPLGVLHHFMDRMDLVVAMDSLALHLAGTTRASTYGTFGPSLGVKYAPMGGEHQIFQGSCPYGQTFVTRCKKMRTCKTGACLRQIDNKKLY